MLCTTDLEERYPNAPEALRMFWKAPVGARLQYHLYRGSLFYRMTKRELNKIGVSSVQRLNDHSFISMEEATDTIMGDSYFRDTVEFVPREGS